MICWIRTRGGGRKRHGVQAQSQVRNHIPFYTSIDTYIHTYIHTYDLPSFKCTTVGACNGELTISKLKTQPPNASAVSQRQQQRTLVTEWSAGTQSLHSYASRQFAGLTKDVYAVRWKKWLDMLVRTAGDSAYVRSKEERRLEREFVSLERAWASADFPAVSCDDMHSARGREGPLQVLTAALRIAHKLDALLL
jgi:hypothetical protein